VRLIFWFASTAGLGRSFLPSFVLFASLSSRPIFPPFFTSPCIPFLRRLLSPTLTDGNTCPRTMWGIFFSPYISPQPNFIGLHAANEIGFSPFSFESFSFYVRRRSANAQSARRIRILEPCFAFLPYVCRYAGRFSFLSG